MDVTSYLDGYQLIAKHSGKCLAVRDTSKSDGAKAIRSPVKIRTVRRGMHGNTGAASNWLPGTAVNVSR
jgi:hypothetical protein